MLFDSFGVEKFLFVSFFQRFYYRIAPKGKQVYGRNDALLRRVSRTRWNGRGEEGGGGRVRPLKIIFLRDWWIMCAVDNVIVLTESWALVSVIQRDYITGNLKNSRPSVKTSNLYLQSTGYLIAYRSILQCYRIYIYIVSINEQLNLMLKLILQDHKFQEWNMLFHR